MDLKEKEWNINNVPPCGSSALLDTTQKPTFLSFRLAYQAPSSIAKAKSSDPKLTVNCLWWWEARHQSIRFYQTLSSFLCCAHLIIWPSCSPDFRSLSNLMTKYAPVCPRCTLLRSGVIFLTATSYICKCNSWIFQVYTSPMLVGLPCTGVCSWLWEAQWIQNVQEYLGTNQMSLEKHGYLCQCRQKAHQNENFRVSLQEEKEDLIDKCAQYKFRQFYPK